MENDFYPEDMQLENSQAAHTQQATHECSDMDMTCIEDSDDSNPFSDIDEAYRDPRPLSGKVKPLACEPVLRNIRTGEIATYRHFEDSDDSSEANPFPDIDEAYRDIISQLH